MCLDDDAVGAQDPVVDSVSLTFYENGWRGVHVEPVPEYAERLRIARPDEQVIEAIVDVQTGGRVFYEFPGTGLSTGSRRIAERHAKSGLEFREVSVPCLPLSTILDSHGKRDIHWLKIDVEGMEHEVLGGLSSAIEVVSFEFIPSALTSALASIGRLEELGRYELNISLGESLELVFDHWQDEDALRRWLATREPDSDSGDVYARLIRAKSDA